MSEGGLELETDEVTWILQPPSPVRVRGSRPVAPDKRDDGVAVTYCLFDCLGEVAPHPDGVDIDEHVLAAEMVGEGVIEPAGVAAGVFTAITDEDARRAHGASARVPATCRCRRASLRRTSSVKRNSDRRGA